MSVRVYLAAGTDGVRALRDSGELRAPAFFVTPAMRAEDPRADEEDLEYEAALLAEEAAREADAGVVVVAADVPASSVADVETPPVVLGPVPRSAVVSLHVAEHGGGVEEELLWYDVAELDDVAAYLRI